MQTPLQTLVCLPPPENLRWHLGRGSIRPGNSPYHRQPVGRSTPVCFRAPTASGIIANSRNSLPSVKGWFRGCVGVCGDTARVVGASLSYGTLEAPRGN